ASSLAPRPNPGSRSRPRHPRPQRHPAAGPSAAGYQEPRPVVRLGVRVLAAHSERADRPLRLLQRLRRIRLLLREPLVQHTHELGLALALNLPEAGDDAARATLLYHRTQALDLASVLRAATAHRRLTGRERHEIEAREVERPQRIERESRA